MSNKPPPRNPPGAGERTVIVKRNQPSLSS